MQDTDPLHDYVETVMLEVMAVLWANGQTKLHVGALMRLLGVPESAASKHDDERIEIDESFAEMVERLNTIHFSANKVPAGATIH